MCIITRTATRPVRQPECGLTGTVEPFCLTVVKYKQPAGVWRARGPSALVCTSNIEPRHRHQLNFSGHQCRSLSDSCPGEGCLPGLPRVDHYMTSALGHRIKKEHSNILVTYQSHLQVTPAFLLNHGHLQ